MDYLGEWAFAPLDILSDFVYTLARLFQHDEISIDQ